MSRTSVANTIGRIRRQLHSGFRYEMSTLSAGITDSTTTIPLSFALPAQLREGALLSIGLESMRVLATDIPGRTATVIRGYSGSTAAAHDSGDQVEINARFEPVSVYEAMVAEIESWSPGLFAVVTDDFDVDGSTETLALGTGFEGCIGVIEALFTPVGSAVARRMDARLVRSENVHLRLINGLSSGSVYVRAALPFIAADLALDDDLVADVGLRQSMIDLVELGCKLRLLVDSEAQRGGRLVQDQLKRAEETPVGAFVPGANFNMTYYRMRKAEETTKLHALYPMVMT